MKKSSLNIGCSGWNYDHWKGLFYPGKSASGTWFKEYSSVFSTVEIKIILQIYLLKVEVYYSPVNIGFLFSKKARLPSSKSRVAKATD